MESLDSLVKALECLDLTADEVDGQSSGIVICGNSFAQSIDLKEINLWHSEEDEREWDEEKEEYKDTILEHILKRMDEHADFLKKVVVEVRKVSSDQGTSKKRLSPEITECPACGCKSAVLVSVCPRCKEEILFNGK